MPVYITYNSRKIWINVSTRFVFIEPINWQIIMCINMTVVYQWVNPEGNDRADQLANKATWLEFIEHAEHIPGTFNHLIDRFISNQLESIYTDHTLSSKDWYKTTTVAGHNFLNKRLSDTQLRRLCFWSIIDSYWYFLTKNGQIWGDQGSLFQVNNERWITISML